jgi:hypothetical protein
MRPAKTSPVISRDTPDIVTDLQKFDLHGSAELELETWVLTKNKVNRLLVFERNVLRTINGSKMCTGVGTVSNSIGSWREQC